MATQWAEIAKRLHFQKEDIQYNRKGKLGPNQKTYLRSGGRNMAYIMLGFCIIMTPIFWFASNGIWGFLMLEGAVIGFAALFSFINMKIMKDDIEAGEVGYIIGKPIMQTKLKGGKIRKVFKIRDREFKAVWLHKMLNEQTQYRAYFAPKSGVLLALEPIKHE